MCRVKTLCSQLPKLRIPEPPVTPREFTLFPKLPPELRVKVWGFGANIPRNIELYFLNPLGVEPDIRNPPLPPILHACREARKEALKYYTESLEYCEWGTKSDEEKEMSDAESVSTDSDLDLELVEPFKRKIYLNFSADQFCLPGIGSIGSIEFFETLPSVEDINFGLSSLNLIQHLQYNLNLARNPEWTPLTSLLACRDLIDLTLELKNWTGSSKQGIETDLYRQQMELKFTSGWSKKFGDHQTALPVKFRWMINGQDGLSPTRMD
jgi:hypothetical protein